MHALLLHALPTSNCDVLWLLLLSLLEHYTVHKIPIDFDVQSDCLSSHQSFRNSRYMEQTSHACSSEGKIVHDVQLRSLRQGLQAWLFVCWNKQQVTSDNAKGSNVAGVAMPEA